jgi:hypothetical protein
MKIHILVILFMLVVFRFVCATEFNDRETEQVELWEKKFSDMSEMTPSDKLSNLWLGLRNMGHRKSLNNHSSSVDYMYHKIQTEMLSIPGHAQYFANQLEAARNKTDKPWLDNKYHMAHQQARETMIHLPSPETVWVLGMMLESEKDLWSRDEILAIWKEQSSKGCHGSAIPCPRSFGGVVLQEIGLRDFPEYQSHEWREAPLVWWRQVVSGQRTFSFKGQSVEYRFKPDGTWDTIPITNPPDDGPKPFSEKSIERPKKQSTGARKESQGTSLDFSWWLYGIVGSMLLALIAWFRSKKRTA